MIELQEARRQIMSLRQEVPAYQQQLVDKGQELKRVREQYDKLEAQHKVFKDEASAKINDLGSQLEKLRHEFTTISLERHQYLEETKRLQMELQAQAKVREARERTTRAQQIELQTQLDGISSQKSY